jgi:hypothetical protein
MQICICVNSCLNAKCERIKLSAIELINSHSKICSPSPTPSFLYPVYSITDVTSHQRKCDMTLIIILIVIICRGQQILQLKFEERFYSVQTVFCLVLNSVFKPSRINGSLL